PEQALVAPHAQALDHALALIGGELERARRLAALLLLLGIEPAEVLSDDFGGGILVNALRAHIPIGDVTAAVEHENRVIGDPLSDCMETPFALQQRLLRLAPLCDVVLERGFDPLALLGLAVQKLARLRKTRGTLFERLLQVVMGLLEAVVGEAALG